MSQSGHRKSWLISFLFGVLAVLSGALAQQPSKELQELRETSTIVMVAGFRVQPRRQV